MSSGGWAVRYWDFTQQSGSVWRGFCEMSLAMPKKRLFSEKPFFSSTQNSVKPRNLRLPGSATSGKGLFRGCRRSHSRPGSLRPLLLPAVLVGVARLLPATTGSPFRHPKRAARAQPRLSGVLWQKLVVSEMYSSKVSRNRPAKSKTQAQSGTEKLSLGKWPRELTYPIQANARGLVPNFADDVSPVQTAGFVAATPDIPVPDALKT